MSTQDEGGDGFGRPRASGRSGSDEGEWGAGHAGNASGGGGGAPGKRTATQDLGARDPASLLLARLNVARGQIGAVRSVYLPALRASIDDGKMQDARTASTTLRQAMSTIARALDDARVLASALGTDRALALIDEVTVDRDTLIAEVEPVRALVPPAAPPIALQTPFAQHLDTAAPTGLDAAEQRSLEQWNAKLDQRAVPDASASPGGKVIDASSRFRSDPTDEHAAEASPMKAGAAVQRRTAGHTAMGDIDVQRAAADGVATGGGPLPHLDAIQRSFGRHDLSGIDAHVGGAAAGAASAIGAEAYATGDHVAFASEPSLFVAAHEAAHVVQQRAGVSLFGGVGQAGDAYEQQADAVAEQVVRGESAEAMLGIGGDRAAQNGMVQRKETPLQSRPPSIEVSHDPVDLGSVTVGQTGAAMVTLINHDDVAVGFPDVMAVGDPAFRCELTGGNHVEPGGYTVVRVTFAPQGPSASSATIYATTVDGAAVSFIARGEGVAAKAETVAPVKGSDRPAPRVDNLHALSLTTEIDDGPAVEVGSRRAYNVYAWNDDVVTRYLDDVTIEGSSAFEVDSVSKTAISPGQSTRILVGFEPPAERVEEATLNVVAQRGPGASLALQGHGVAAVKAKVDGTATKRGDGKDNEPAAPSSTKASDFVATAPIEFGDVEVGTAVTKSVHLFNLSHETFRVSKVRIAASAGKFRMLETPQLMYSSRENNQRPMEHPFGIEYLPSWPGNHDTTLGFQVEGDTAGAEWIEVPIVAKSHYAGEPSYEEQQVADREAGEAKKQREAQERRKTEDDKKTKPYPENARSAFEDARADAVIEAGHLYYKEAAGVREASEEAKSYKRLPKSVSRWMLSDLAELGLSMAIAGVAGAVALKAGKWLKGLGRGGSTGADQDDTAGGVSDTFVKFVEESVKELIKGGTRLVRANLAIAGTGDAIVSDEGSDTASSNPRIAFFSASQNALIDSSADRQHALISMAALLRPYLRSEPQLAIDALRAIEAAFKAESTAAAYEHAHHAAAGWVRVVAQSALGVQDAGPRGKPDPYGAERPVTNVRKDETLSHTAIDGLLDVEFDLVPTDPHLAVTVRRASLRGVSQEIANRIRRDMDLRSAGLPLRVRCVPAHMDSFPITITRDEVGNRFIAEGDTQTRQYLARKADAAYRPSSVHDEPDAGMVRAGARILLEEEVLGAGRLAVDMVVTDDGTGSGDE